MPEPASPRSLPCTKQDTVKTYASQIQILALRNTELTKQNRSLAQALERHNDVTHLPSASARQTRN